MAHAAVNLNLALLALDSGTNNTSPNIITPSGVSALTGVTGGSWGTPGTQDAVFTRGADGTIYAVCLTGLATGSPPAATSIWKSDATQLSGWSQVSTYTNGVMTERTLGNTLATGTYLFVQKDALYEFAQTKSGSTTYTPSLLRKSTDGGQNWTNLTTPGAVTQSGGLAKFFVKPSGLIVWGCSQTGGFGTWIVSTDGGTTFNTVTATSAVQALYDMDWDGTNFGILSAAAGTGAMHFWQGTSVTTINNDRQTVATFGAGIGPGNLAPCMLTMYAGAAFITIAATSANFFIYTATNVASATPFTSRLDLGSATVQPAQVYPLSDAKNYMYYNGALYSDRSGSWASYVGSLSNNFGPICTF